MPLNLERTIMNEATISWTPIELEINTELFEISDFMRAVNQGEYTEDDGASYYAKAGVYSHSHPVLDNYMVKVPPSWATHVIWFAK
jgi:hypothetical protein